MKNFDFKQILPLAFILLGLVVASLIDLSELPGTIGYEYLIYTLLAIGLYGSVYSIDVSDLRNNQRIVLSAITVGVVLKAGIMGVVLYFFTKDISAFLLGIAVAQIDPLSVANLLQGQIKLSSRGKTILAAWSSFDDPMTVILSLYVFALVLPNDNYGNSFGLFLLDFILNLLFALLFYFVYKLTVKFERSKYLFLLICFVVAVNFKFMLGIAIVGLFWRPSFEQVLSKLVSWSFSIASLLLGFILIKGISLQIGLILGVAAIVAQIFASIVLTFGLTKHERIKLAFAQQNGITAIILALFFESQRSGIVAVVAPAILVINALHWLLNSIVDKNSHEEAIS